jgi:hypothetical protein
MILAVHNNASYLSEQNGESRASVHFYLTNHDDKEFNNGTILTLSSIIKHVMSSASKVEFAALYYGCKLAVPIRTTLKEMQHPQLKRTMITTNNITAQGLTMGTMTPKASKIDGSMLPLAQTPQCTMPIPLPVALRHKQLCQLCKQASSSKTSPSSPSILHPGHFTTTMKYFPLSILICSPCFHTS